MAKKKTSSKGKTPSPRDYTASSKKGWITRRKNKRAEKLGEEAAYLGRKKPFTQEQFDILWKQKNQLERKIAEVIAQKVTQPEESGGIMWYNAHPIEYLHKDGTIAAQPSILRHYEKVKKIERQIKTLFGQFKPKRRAGRTDEEISESVLYGAQDIADFYGVDVREVFTLYYSP